MHAVFVFRFMNIESLIALLNDCDVLGITVTIMKKHLVLPGTNGYNLCTVMF